MFAFWFWFTYQVRLDLTGGISTSNDKCLFTWSLMWNFVWICMYVILKIFIGDFNTSKLT